MNGRKREVLRAVVDDYVATAEPVASKTLAQRYPFGVSSATIRGEMADLEADGYLLQRHTSAGRIPSDKGYRYYVDELIAFQPPTPGERAQMAAILGRRGAEAQWLLRELGHLLADATRCAAVAVGAHTGPVHVRHITTVATEPQRALLVLVTDQDTVVHRSVDLPEGLGQAELEALVAAASQRLTGQGLGRAGRTVWQEVYDLTAPFRALADAILSLLDTDPLAGEERVFLGGASHLVGQPEFQDAERIRTLLDFLDRPEAVESLLNEAATPQGLRVRIGQENQTAAMQEMSLVTAPVRQGERVVGYLAVLGPTRMPYGRVLGIMEALNRIGVGFAG
ncbi:MAG: heat-inducible transcriptional repressor HrcA [Firmicutes bacterium]|nr:heat-inducible transcriptional repressor HrcA [Bacillota bacterium]